MHCGWFGELEELYSAEEVGRIVGVPVDKVYTLNLPGFNPGERRNRWDGFTLADFLERKKTSNGVFTYTARIANMRQPFPRRALARYWACTATPSSSSI